VEDFPDWVDPMVVKELRQGLRARGFVVPFVWVHAAAVALGWLEYLAVMRPGTPFASTQVGTVLFWGLVFLSVGVVLPLRSLAGLTGEMSGDGAGLILLAGLSRWKIVMGKWLTQMTLAGLILVSLAPYGLVRYFFGGVELLPNLLCLAAAAGLSAAMNGLMLGASGYGEPWMRALIALTAAVYVAAPLSLVAAAPGMGSGDGGWLAALWLAWAGLGLALARAFFTLCGLQLARARLRAGLRPWEVPPSRPVLVLFFLSPVYFGLPSLLTCGIGFPIVAAAMLWWMWSLDPAEQPVRSKFHFLHPPPRATLKTYRF